MSNKSKFQESERNRQVELLKVPYLFNGDTAGSCFRGKQRDFVLHDWHNNFFSSISEKVLNYFCQNGITWWGGKQPTGHILSSQVACLNHLFPILADKQSVLSLAKTILEDFTDVLPLSKCKDTVQYLSFEAVSNQDHLNECGGKRPTRGTQCTSIDAIIQAKHKDGKIYLLPIEWKYTECYNDTDKSKEDRANEPKGSEGKGKERLLRYTKLLDHSRQLKTLSDYRGSIYFYEPFYQLMRQTLWAEQMLEHRGTETIQADDFIHVHIVPENNHELLHQKYSYSGKNMEETWKSCLTDESKYIVLSPKGLLRNIDNIKYANLLKYLQERYWNEKHT